MKKLFISLLAIAATVNAMAIEISAKATLELTSNGGEVCTMKLFQTSDSKAANYCAPINMTGRVVALYSISNSKNYQDLYIADLDNVALGLMTNADTEYTINFSNVIGKLYLVDAVEDKYIEITEGGSYAFTAEANQTIADRFSIAKSLPYSFINNRLVINEATAGAEIIITPFTYGPQGRALGSPIITHAPMDEDLTGMGYVLVSYTNKNGVEREFIVNTNPTVTPVN